MQHLLCCYGWKIQACHTLCAPPLVAMPLQQARPRLQASEPWAPAVPCSLLLRLASRRDHAQPAPEPQAEQPGNPAAAAAAAAGGGEDGGGLGNLESVLGGAAAPAAMVDPWDDLAAKCKSVTLITAMDIVYDSSAVLTYWAPRPGKALGEWLRVGWATEFLVVPLSGFGAWCNSGRHPCQQAAATPLHPRPAQLQLVQPTPTVWLRRLPLHAPCRPGAPGGLGFVPCVG